MLKRIIYIPLFLLIACSPAKKADAIYFNGVVYTVDSAFTKAEAFAVKDGKIIAVGSNDEIKEYDAPAKTDLLGACVYPGFIDAHCHFYGYGIDLKKIWLSGTKSFDEILDTLQKHHDQLFMGWLFGRGWDQNDWEKKVYPDRAKLDSLFPDIPVFLMRIDGHAALVNSKALQIAGITASTKINGGEILIKDGKPTGLLIDNAVDLVKDKIPEPAKEARTEALLSAQRNCFAVGLTTVDDAGLEREKIELIDELQRSGSLKMRVYAMIAYNYNTCDYFFKRGPVKTERLNVRSFKLYADGALGSRGATLLQPYSDMKDHYGFLLHDIDSLRLAATQVAAHGFQLNTHCIGDSANRLMLHIYSEALKGKKDQRWRIEHAQVIAPDDFRLFGENGVIPSVQPTHATSDMYWAGDRIGTERLKGAYAYRTLMLQNNMIADGSDFPVEDINPLYGFYAAVVRKDKEGYPEAGFQMNDALTKEEALRAMTIWAAYANFEEHEKGSITPGKFADFVILDDDIMQCNPDKIFSAKVKSTYVNGEKVY